MRFHEVTRMRINYLDDAHTEARRLIDEERNAYAVNRLLGQSQAAWEVKTNLTQRIRQLKVELRGELEAIEKRRKSVLDALTLLEQPIKFPAWPETNHLSHEDVMDDALRNHRGRYHDKLERLKAGKGVANASRET